MEESKNPSGENGQKPSACSVHPYQHLFAGVSYMAPLVIAGGVSAALALAFGGSHEQGSLAWALNLIGHDTAFQLFISVLSGFIAYSIGGRPALGSGLIGGMLAQRMNIGFLGGIVAGFLAGYLTVFLIKFIQFPVSLDGLKTKLILPCVSSISVGLAMIYFVEPPVRIILDALLEWLTSMQGTHALLLGALLGGMMAFDMGGPINKTASAFAVGMLTGGIYTPMAAVMVAGMTPPVGIALAACLFKNRFNAEERRIAASAFVLGLVYITEGAIPFAAKNPLRVIPALVAGGAISGAISMFYGVQLLLPHGGILASLIPKAVQPLPPFFLALTMGAFLTAGLLFTLKKPIIEKEITFNDAEL